MSIRKIKTLKIGPVKYKMLHVDIPAEGDKTFLGRIYYDKAEIHVAKSMVEQPAMFTIVHEFFHGLCHLYGIGKHTENQIDALSLGVIEFIQNNPQLVKTIQELK